MMLSSVRTAGPLEIAGAVSPACHAPHALEAPRRQVGRRRATTSSSSTSPVSTKPRPEYSAFATSFSGWYDGANPALVGARAKGSQRLDDGRAPHPAAWWDRSTSTPPSQRLVRVVDAPHEEPDDLSPTRRR